MMELNMAMGKGKKLEESRGQKMDEDFNTDRDIFKGLSTSFMFAEDKEFAKVFDKMFEFRDDENFDRLITGTYFNYKKVTEINEEFGDITKEIFTNELGENKYKSHPERLKQGEKFAKGFYTINSKYKEDDKFDLLFDNKISPKLDDDERFAETFDFAKGTFANKFEEPT